MSVNSAFEKCAGCTKPLPKKEYLRCALCKAAYDIECANVSSKRYYAFYALEKQRRDSWKCPECQSKMPKTGNVNTPVRSGVQDGFDSTSIDDSPNNLNDRNVTLRAKSCKIVAAEGGAANLSFNQNRTEDLGGTEVVASNIMEELKLFSGEMRAAREEMCMFRETVAGLFDTIKAQNIRIELLEDRINILESKLNENHNHKCNASDLDGTILQLKMEIHDKDQEMLVNDVEIAGFPEVRNENTVHAVQTIAMKLGVQLEDRDIVSAERVGPPRAFLEGQGAPRPRPLAVRLTRRHTRDALLEAARVRRRLSTEGMGLPGATRFFYVNERLTRHNRQLFQKAREVAAQMNWKYVWTRGGRVYARQEHEKERHRLRTDRDLAKVFGTSRVGHT